MPSPRPALTAPIIPALLLLLAGCGAGSPPPIEDLPLLEAVPELRIGSLDDPETMLTRVAQLVVGRDGRIYTSHPQESAILVHDAVGARVGRLGGPGEGPGEFRAVRRMGFVGDTLWALDSRLYRITWFAPGGALPRSVTIPIDLRPDDAGRSPPRPDGLLPDGRVFGSPPAWSRLVATGEITETPVVVMDTAGEAGDTLFMQPQTVWAIQDPSAPFSFGSYRAQPFADEALHAMVPGASATVVVDRAVRPDDDAPAFRVARVSFDGDTAFSRAFPYAPLPIDPATPDSLVAAFAGGLRDSAIPGAPTVRQATEWARANLYVPAHHPPVTALVPGRDGTVWLRRPGADPAVAEWLVLDANGLPIGRVALPAAVQVHAAERGTVWGVETDELDVPYIVRYGVGSEAAGQD